MILSGTAGKLLVSDTARLFQAYTDNSGLEDIAIEACMCSERY